MPSSPFDLAQLDTKTSGETGVPMPIINPRSRSAYLNEDGAPLTITLLGRHSETFREIIRLQQEQRDDLTSRGMRIPNERWEQDNIGMLIVCTREWTFQILDGQPFPCTPANVRKLWTDQRFRGLREAATSFILSDGNYLPNLPVNCDDSLDTTSFSAGSSHTAAPSEMSSAAIP